MKILAIESSAVTASVAILDDGQVLAQSVLDCGLTHSRTLMPQIESLLEITSLPLSDMDLVAVAHGPGSFTGVRIGVSCAAGLALGGAIPALGVSSLEAMAFGAGVEGLVCPMMDARRGEVYTALFRIDHGVPSRLMEDCAIGLTTLAQRLSQYDGAIYLVGDGAHLGADIPNCRLAPAHLRRQRADGVGLCAFYHQDQAGPARELAPVYLRLSQAEREKLEKGRGTANE